MSLCGSHKQHRFPARMRLLELWSPGRAAIHLRVLVSGGTTLEVRVHRRRNRPVDVTADSLREKSHPELDVGCAVVITFEAQKLLLLSGEGLPIERFVHAPSSS